MCALLAALTLLLLCLCGRAGADAPVASSWKSMGPPVGDDPFMLDLPGAAPQ